MHRKLNYETKGIQYEIKVVHSMFYALALWIVIGFFADKPQKDHIAKSSSNGLNLKLLTFIY